MKKSKNGKTQENTLFSYFSKVKQPKPKESLSDIIAKTTPPQPTQPKPRISSSFTQSSYSASISTSISSSTIDLTNDDDDLVILPPSDSPFSSQTSLFSSSSQSSGQLRNTSKFNNKGWSVRDVELGFERSSQDIVYSQEPKPVPRYEKIRLQQPRITPRANYDWLGPNDVKPFSSKMPSKSGSFDSSSSRPQVIEEFQRPSTQEKRNWSSSSFSQDEFQWPSAMKKEKKTVVKKEKSLWTKPHIKEEKSLWTKPRVKEEKVTMGVLANRAQFNVSLDQEYAPELSSEQQRVLNMVVNQRQSLFFTGSAGTGKSVLLRAIISRMRDEYGSQCAVTASTGIAACNIGGCTLHSFAGIGTGADSVQQLVYKISQSSKARARWQETVVLIIDEISMVDGNLFDKLDAIAKQIRHIDKPFGGIQVVVTGDFFQLPPVKQTKFAFEAEAWKTAITNTVMLTKVFRQKDETFVKILNEMRLGMLSTEAINTFHSLSREPEGDSDLEPTELYPMRNEVDESNRRKLDQLKGEMFEFAARDRGDSRKLEQCLAPAIIRLKKNAQVMLLKNIDADLVNGSIGVVIGFAGHGEYRSPEKCERLRTPQHQRESLMNAFENGKGFQTKTPWPIVRFSNERIMLFEHESWSIELPGGREPAVRYQVPLTLAWAISIHKSQGQTLDRVKVDLGKVFEKGQAYVALSRATSLDTLQILNFNPSKVMAHPTVTRFYKTLQTV